jgi:hypothetical protein
MARVRKLLRSTARIAGSRALWLLVGMAVLFAVARGGTRYFYCPITHLADDEPLCTPGHDQAPDSDSPTIQASDCCQVKWRPAAPTASTPENERPSIPSAGLGASPFVPQLDITVASAKIPFGVTHAVRAGPPPQSAVERRAQLMVFHN